MSSKRQGCLLTFPRATKPPPPAAAAAPPSHPPHVDMAGGSSAPAPAPAIVRDGTVASPLLGPLLDEWGDVFAEEVLKRWLNPTDCALFARACWKCGEAVASAGLVCAGDNAEVPLEVRTFASGSVELLAWAQANGCPWEARTSACVAAVGNLAVLQWAREHECPWDEHTCKRAAREGLLEVLMWARAHDCPWDSMTCAWAAAGGHLEVMQWAREHGAPWDEAYVRGLAEAGGLLRTSFERR